MRDEKRKNWYDRKNQQYRYNRMLGPTGEIRGGALLSPPSVSRAEIECLRRIWLRSPGFVGLEGGAALVLGQLQLLAGLFVEDVLRAQGIGSDLRTLV